MNHPESISIYLIKLGFEYIQKQNYDTSLLYIEVNRNRRLFWKVRYYINLNRDTVFNMLLRAHYSSYASVLFSEDIEITENVDMIIFFSRENLALKSLNKLEKKNF